MKRFLVSHSLVAGSRIQLPPEESKHAVRVMRLEAGAKVLLTDGRGFEADAILISTDKSGAVFDVGAVREARAKAYRLELLQGLLKGPRMDWLVEKATELGVSAIRAVDTEYAVAGERTDRWARVAQAALKQSGNLMMPDFPAVCGLAEALDQLAPGYQGLLLSPAAEVGLAPLIKSLGPSPGLVILAIGPEGGFSPEEEKLLETKGFRACLLSRQILRGETAALVAASVALHALEFPDSNKL